MKSSASNSSRAFTLIELLVVIGVIALLISILLPSLSTAKRVTKTVTCATNIKGMGLEMREYASEYRDAILGNAYTTAAFLTTTPPGGKVYSVNNIPNICQVWDWASPAAAEAGVQFDAGPNLASRTARFDTLCRYKGFLCPENDILSDAYYQSDVQNLVTPMVSYDTALMFQDPYPEPGKLPVGAASGLDTFALGQSFINTGSYLPNINYVGDPTVKIFIADGGRFCESDGSPPDYDLEYGGSGSPGGVYADYGPWSYYTRAYGHSDLGDSPSTKPITYSMRHGSRKPNTSLGAYRFNAGFFDGHVETLDGAHGLNPNLWMPTGAILPTSECTKDTITNYFNGNSTLLISNTPP